jgi:hypothetical protein
LGIKQICDTFGGRPRLYDEKGRRQEKFTANPLGKLRGLKDLRREPGEETSWGVFFDSSFFTAWADNETLCVTPRPQLVSDTSSLTVVLGAILWLSAWF